MLGKPGAKRWGNKGSNPFLFPPMVETGESNNGSHRGKKPPRFRYLSFSPHEHFCR